MYQEVVVKEALTPEMIAAGAELTRRLDEDGFELVASFWLYTSEIKPMAPCARLSLRDHGRTAEGISPYSTCTVQRSR